ncbi:baseplate wedge protein 53 [bacterium]|jgi:hypothetical protein|nr:baseplate wedge protein 53 [bacterium]MDC1257336.1 baseplate wedge protein 53 [bacterium]
MAIAKYSAGSVYRSTTIIDNKYLDIYNSEIDFTKDYGLSDYTIENKYNLRPDLLAHKLYGDSNLWWVFAKFNQDELSDPIFDFVSGLEIQVPERFN